MASLILGAGALVSERMRRRLNARNENKREFEEHFEEMKRQNELRENQRRFHRATSHSHDGTQSIYDTDPPPYEVVVKQPSATSSVASSRKRSYREAPESRRDSTDLTAEDRIATRDMA